MNFFIFIAALKQGAWSEWYLDLEDRARLFRCFEVNANEPMEKQTAAVLHATPSLALIVPWQYT